MYQNNNSKKIWGVLGIVVVVLVLFLTVGGIGYLSKGFLNWDWVKAKEPAEPEPTPEPETIIAYTQPEFVLEYTIDDFEIEYDAASQTLVAICVFDGDIDDWSLLPVAFTLEVSGSGGGNSKRDFLGVNYEVLGSDIGSGTYSYRDSSRDIVVANKVYMDDDGEPVIDDAKSMIMITLDYVYAAPAVFNLTLTDINTYLAELEVEE